LLGITTVAGAGEAPRAAAAVGYQYKITFTGTGALTVTDNDGTGCNDENEKANWTIAPPQPVTMWIPKFNGPPGTEYKQVLSTGDSANPAGTVTDNGDYCDNPSGGSPEPFPYSCQGPVGLLGSSTQFTVDVGPYSPQPAIQTDFVGLMQAGGGSGDESLTPSSCNTDPAKKYAPQSAFGFLLEWLPAGWAGPTADGEQLAVGTLTPPQDIGLQSFGLAPLQDYSQVTDPEACRWSSPSENCKFKLSFDGDYEFTLLCAGTVSAGSSGYTGACGGGGTGTGTGTGTGGKGPGTGTGGSGSAGTATKCTVPALEGKTQTAATTALKHAGCALGTVTKKSSSSVASGKVISSSPGAGATKTAGTKVNLVLSTGKAARCVVPKLTGKTLPSAKSALAAARCKLGTVTRKTSSSTARGRIVSSSPKSGSTHAANPAVKLVVSRGRS
jgi:hypothetical protein